MLEYLDGKLVVPSNKSFSSAVAQKALHTLQDIHKIAIYHGDIYDNRLICNLMLLKNGEVVWFDFEHSKTNENETAHSFVHALAEELLGEDSYLHKCAMK
jgi:RIO-like serine/threonine protein kinase